MASNSGRRSGSSDDSSRRKSVYISGRGNDRALDGVRDAAARNSESSGAGGHGGRGKAPKKERSRRRPTPASRKAATPAHSSAAAERAAERKSERESRRLAQRRTMRIRVAAVVLVVTGVVSACVTVYNSSVFRVGRVEVVGVVNLSADAVRAMAKVPPEATLIRFPSDQVAARVAKDPWVESVTVSRVFPDGMRIRVVERRPIAMVDAGATFWLVDAGGTILAQRTAEQTSTTIVIRDVPGLDPKPGRRTASEPLLNAVKVLAGLPASLVSTVKSVSAPTVDGTTLYTGERIEIVVGEAVELAKKGALALQILAEQRGKVVSIDVRTTDRPTWRGFTR
jgi:cell division protein FtsQ